MTLTQSASKRSEEVQTVWITYPPRYQGHLKIDTVRGGSIQQQKHTLSGWAGSIVAVTPELSIRRYEKLSWSTGMQTTLIGSQSVSERSQGFQLPVPTLQKAVVVGLHRMPI